MSEIIIPIFLSIFISVGIFILVAGIYRAGREDAKKNETCSNEGVIKRKYFDNNWLVIEFESGNVSYYPPYYTYSIEFRSQRKPEGESS